MTESNVSLVEIKTESDKNVCINNEKWNEDTISNKSSDVEQGVVHNSVPSDTSKTHDDDNLDEDDAGTENPEDASNDFGMCISVHFPLNNYYTGQHTFSTSLGSEKLKIFVSFISRAKILPV